MISDIDISSYKNSKKTDLYAYSLVMHNLK